MVSRTTGCTRVEELDWWQEREHRGLRFVCVPAQHFSQRTPWDSGRRLWSSWAVIGQGHRFYFSGDTGYFDGFREAGERLGPFDLAAIAIGAYVPADDHALRAHDARAGRASGPRTCASRVLLGIHWGTFDLAEEPLDEPPRRMLAEAAATRASGPERAWIFKIGETRALVRSRRHARAGC